MLVRTRITLASQVVMVLVAVTLIFAAYLAQQAAEDAVLPHDGAGVPFAGTS